MYFCNSFFRIRFQVQISEQFVCCSQRIAIYHLFEQIASFWCMLAKESVQFSMNLHKHHLFMSHGWVESQWHLLCLDSAAFLGSRPHGLQSLRPSWTRKSGTGIRQSCLWKMSSCVVNSLASGGSGGSPLSLAEKKSSHCAFWGNLGHSVVKICPAYTSTLEISTTCRVLAMLLFFFSPCQGCTQFHCTCPITATIFYSVLFLFYSPVQFTVALSLTEVTFFYSTIKDVGKK